jgi:Dolichyl-phosphate-mannose-protein mannosyltransferase
LATRLRAGTAAVAVLIAVGVALRVTYYVRNPSFSFDEAALALNLIHRSFSGLFGRLDFNQAAPPAFLVLQKLAISALEATPSVFRIVPLLAAIGAVLLLYPVARRFVGRRAALLALALFVVSDLLSTYAATNKQYSLDVAVALGLYMTVLALPERTGTRGALLLAAAGAFGVWLSHPAAFVLAGIGTVLLVDAARARDRAGLSRVAGAITVWLGSFVVAFVVTRSSVEHLQTSLAGNQPKLLGGGNQPSLLQTWGGIVRELLGISAGNHRVRNAVALLAMLLALLGLVALWRARAAHAAMLVLPAAVGLVAAELNKYALFTRTFLFTIPALVILVAYGTHFLTTRRRARVFVVLGAAAFALLLGTEAYATVDALQSRRSTEPARALRYLAAHARPTDSLYINLGAQLDYRYYVGCGCFGSSSAVHQLRAFWPVRPAGGSPGFLESAPPHLVAGKSRGQTALYAADFASLRDKRRVWVLVMEPNSKSEQALEAFLRRTAIRKRIFPRSDKNPIAWVALYDFRP